MTDLSTDDDFEDSVQGSQTGEDSLDYFDSKQATTLMVVAACGMLVICATLCVCLCRCAKKRRNQKIAIVGEIYEPAIKTERAQTQNEDGAFPGTSPIEIITPQQDKNLEVVPACMDPHVMDKEERRAPNLSLLTN